VFIRTDGVVVVDTKNPGWGQPILDEIKKLTPKPVTTIINTHTHGDHTSGNVAFPATVDVVVQENTKTNMQRWVAYTGQTQPVENVFKENNDKGMPKRTFKDRMTIGSGADEIDLYYFGRGHTNGDAFVVFPALRAMHAGDIFLGKTIPFLDANNGGSGIAIGETLAKAHDTIKNIDSIITGHSTVMTMNDLAGFAQFNRDFLKAVQDAKNTGKTVDAAAASWAIPPAYRGYATPDPAALKRNIQVVYDELK
jgi:cyclase